MKPTIQMLDTLLLSSIAAAVVTMAMASSGSLKPMYAIEAEQAGYADEYIYGATGCEGADDPAETVLAITYAELSDAGCVSIFEI
jgi:hypothetical protein